MVKSNRSKSQQRLQPFGRMQTFLAASLALAASTCLSSASNAETVLQGSVCSARVHDLTANVHWYNDLNEAEAAAQQQGKLVFWMHMLGKIDGAT